MYQKPNVKAADTSYVLTSTVGETEKRATDVMGVVSDQSRKVIAMEYLVDRTVNWVGITGLDSVDSEG